MIALAMATWNSVSGCTASKVSHVPKKFAYAAEPGAYAAPGAAGAGQVVKMAC